MASCDLEFWHCVQCKKTIVSTARKFSPVFEHSSISYASKRANEFAHVFSKMLESYGESFDLWLKSYSHSQDGRTKLKILFPVEPESAIRFCGLSETRNVNDTLYERQ